MHSAQRVLGMLLDGETPRRIVQAASSSSSSAAAAGGAPPAAAAAAAALGNASRQVVVHTKSWGSFAMELTLMAVPLIMGGYAIRKLLNSMPQFGGDEDEGRQRAALRAKAILQARLDQTGRRLKEPVSINQYEMKVLGEIVFPDQITESFASVGGLESLKLQLLETVVLPLSSDLLQQAASAAAVQPGAPRLLQDNAMLAPPRGLLFYGPPGTGKTLLAKALCKKTGATFIPLTSSFIQSKWVGDSSKLIRAIFTLARKTAPSIIFIDEIDCVCSSRSSSMSSHPVDRQISSELFRLWDGLDSGDGSDRVTVLACSNRPWEIDEAVLRRLPRTFEFTLPPETERLKILRVILEGFAFSEEDMSQVARRTKGYSGSDLKELCKLAVSRPVREAVRHDLMRAAGDFDGMVDAAVGAGGGGGGGGVEQFDRASAARALRNVTLDDFEDALTKVRPSGETSLEYKRKLEADGGDDHSGNGSDAGGMPPAVLLQLLQALSAASSGGAGASSPKNGRFGK